MARNDITGDSIANTKGSAEKYAQGWDRLFGKKAEEQSIDSSLECINAEIMANSPLQLYSPPRYQDGVKSVKALDFHDSIDGLVHTTCFDCGHSFPVCDRDRYAQCPECGTTWEQDCEA